MKLLRRAAALLLTATLGVTACGSGTTSESETTSPSNETDSGDAAASQSGGGDLAVFVSSDPGNLDPAQLSSYDQTLMSTNVLEGLYRLSKDGTSVEPGLAESSEVSEDGLTWTISLRDATFHDGEPVTAAAVKFSYERVVAPDTNSPKAGIIDMVAGATAYRMGDADGIDGITVVDERTIQFELVEPFAAFGALMASPNLALVSPAAVEELGEDFGIQAVSAGPFQLTAWNSNDSIVAESFADYWEGEQPLDTVTWRVVPDESTRMVEFEAGQLDITWLPPAQYSAYADDDAWDEHIHRAETIHTEFLTVNMDRGPLGENRDLREAICLALDREAVVASLQGRANVGEGLFPPAMGISTPDQPCGHDPDRATELVGDAEVGPLTLIAPPWGNLTSTLQLYQDNLANVGIDVELEALEFAQYQERLTGGDFDLAWHYRVPDYLDPNSFVRPLVDSSQIGSGNVARYTNADVDEILAEAASVLDEDQRLDLYAQVEQQVREDMPYIPLTHNIYVDISRQVVSGYTPSAMDAHNYRGVTVSD